jgi:hypothetical protein
LGEKMPDGNPTGALIIQIKGALDIWKKDGYDLMTQ